jgi:uncharacterized OsmC-like protein
MSEVTVTKLTLLEGYKSLIRFDDEDIPDLLVDEPEPIGESRGPNATQLLSAAVGHCLNSTLIFCLNKERVKVKKLETTVSLRTARNDENRLRVSRMDAEISLDVDEEDRERIRRCLEVFENYCTVSASVRKGIEINVKIRQNDEIIHIEL